MHFISIPTKQKNGTKSDITHAEALDYNMFFKYTVNYKTKPVVPTYPSKITYYKLVKVEPPTTKDTAAIPFLKPIWKMQKETVNMQEQIDLQKSSLITPEYVLKTGNVPDANNVQYNQFNDNAMNAADKIQAAKELNAFVIHQQAEQLANNDIKKLIKQKEIELQNLKAKDAITTTQQTKELNNAI